VQQGLISDNAVVECQKLVDLCFDGNGILDNIVYSMDVLPLNTPNLYNFCHYTLSHALPTIFADNITDFLLLRGSRVYRGAITEHNKIYNNIIECLEDIVEVFSNIQKQIELSIDIAVDNNDKAIEDFLRDFNVKTASLFIKQSIVLLDGAKKYGESGILPLFNDGFEKYIILPEELVKYN
jgi:hypothetical protein